MTQQELLADAARTEIENAASLKLLLAMEEETKRKAAVVKKKFQGPLVKLHSKRVAVVPAGGGGGGGGGEGWEEKVRRVGLKERMDLGYGTRTLLLKSGCGMGMLALLVAWRLVML